MCIIKFKKTQPNTQQSLKESRLMWEEKELEGLGKDDKAQAFLPVLWI